MSSPKKKTSETVSFINTTNPEIFQVHPRPGGLLHIEAFNAKPSKTEETIAVTPTHLDESISKEFRVQTALDETLSFDSEDATLPNPVKDAKYMFGVAISSVILLASGHSNIPEEHLQWTQHCLECITDEFDNHPPNVQGLLNHIRKLQSQNASPKETEPPPEVKEEPDDGEEQTIKTTTRVKMENEEEEPRMPEN